MIESIMNLHKCSECSIRCKAIERPHSLYAHIHRWHSTWWPGWKLYKNKEITRQDDSQDKGRIAQVTLARGLEWGLIGGFAGTMVMDIVLMAALPMAGFPALTCFSIVGDTVAKFFSMYGIEMTAGAPLGVTAHYLIGPAVGAIFGAAVTQFKVLRPDTLKKSIILAILYVQILSQPILATTPILLKMTVAETLQWYGGSFAMHSVLGLVLGVIMSYGLNSSATANR